MSNTIYDKDKQLELENKILKELEPFETNFILLDNSNFKDGSYIITQPGKYILTEDIIFNPNFDKMTDNNFLLFPTGEQLQKPPYNTQPFQLGFFSAIIIQSNHVIIDLNGYSISQSKIHYLQQRFFSIINLNSSMFIQSQGPNNGSLSSDIKEVDTQYIHIKNGKFGLTSHYGVMGNNNSHIIIDNCEFIHFETGGISLNNCDTSIFKNIKIHDNNINIPVTGNYSVLVNTLITLKKCNPSLLTNIKIHNDTAIHCLHNLDKLNYRIIKNYLINEYKTIKSNTHQDIYEDEIDKLYYNKTGLSDGSSIVGIQITPKGVAIGDFTTNACNFINMNNITDTKKECPYENIYTNSDYCHHLYFDTVDIYNIITNINQNITMNYQNKPLSGCFGDIIVRECLIDNKGYYNKNILYDNLICLAKIIKKENNNIVTSNFLPDCLIEWCDNLTDKTIYELEEYKDISFNYQHDIMLHTNKGCISLRLGGINYLSLNKINIYNIVNQGVIIEKDKFDSNTYSGNKAYGITLSYCRNIQFKDGLNINHIISKHNQSYDILIQE